MVKCSNEDKCVPEDTAEYCFTPFTRNCKEINPMSDHHYQCFDGKCRKDKDHCATQKVCPPGFT